MRVKVDNCFECGKDLFSPKDTWDKSFFTCPVCRARFCPQCWESFRREKTGYPCPSCKRKDKEIAERKRREEKQRKVKKREVEKKYQENLRISRERLMNILKDLEKSGFSQIDLKSLLKDFPSVAEDYIYTSAIVGHLAKKLNINLEEIRCNEYYAAGIGGSSAEIVYLGRRYILLDCLPHVDEPKACFSLKYLWLLESRAQEAVEPPVEKLKAFLKAVKEESEIRHARFFEV